MRFFTFTLAALTLGLSLVAAVPTPRLSKRVDYWPAVLYPSAGSVFKAGDSFNVTWNTTLPSYLNISDVGQTANLYLTYLLSNETGFNDERLLKSGVPLYANGRSEVTLPTNLTTQTTYVIVLIGSSGDHSKEFTINALDATT